MQFSKRITGLTGGGDDGWSVFYKARAMVARGEKVVELTIGEPDIRTAPEILDAMAASTHGGHTGYAAIPGTKALREAVARREYARTGVATGAENVLITPGGQAALFAAHIGCCDPGDRALFIDPYYVTYPGTIRAASAEPVVIAARPEDGFQPRADAIASAAEGAKSLLINTPNNPTGVVYSRATLEGIAQVCAEHAVWLISDEVYDSQVWEGEHLSPRALPGMQDRTLVVGSLSKSHAMTGSRLGWIVGPEDAIAHLSNLATHTNYGVPGFIQDAAVFALAQGAAMEREVAAPFRRRRELARALIAGQNVVRMVPSGGAMYVMLDIRATGLSGEAFALGLLEDEAIAVMPGESFGHAAQGHVRVALTVADEALKAALSRLLSYAARKAG